MGGIVYGWFAYLKTKQGREFWDRTRIKLLFGVIAHKICLASFYCRPWRRSSERGSDSEVLNIVANTCGNVVMEKAIRVASSDIERGDGIPRPQQTSGVPDDDYSNDHGG